MALASWREPVSIPLTWLLGLLAGTLAIGWLLGFLSVINVTIGPG